MLPARSSAEMSKQRRSCCSACVLVSMGEVQQELANTQQRPVCNAKMNKALSHCCRPRTRQQVWWDSRHQLFDPVKEMKSNQKTSELDRRYVAHEIRKYIYILWWRVSADHDRVKWLGNKTMSSSESYQMFGISNPKYKITPKNTISYLKMW